MGIAPILNRTDTQCKHRPWSALSGLFVWSSTIPSISLPSGAWEPCGQYVCTFRQQSAFNPRESAYRSRSRIPHLTHTSRESAWTSRPTPSPEGINEKAAHAHREGKFAESSRAWPVLGHLVPSPASTARRPDIGAVSGPSPVTSRQDVEKAHPWLFQRLARQHSDTR